MPETLKNQPKSQTEIRETAKFNANGTLQQYELRAIGEQISAANKLGVDPKIAQDVRNRQFVLERKVQDGGSATELDAMRKGLSESIDRFTEAVKKAEDEKEEKEALDKMENSFK